MSSQRSVLYATIVFLLGLLIGGAVCWYITSISQPDVVPKSQYEADITALEKKVDDFEKTSRELENRLNETEEKLKVAGEVIDNQTNYITELEDQNDRLRKKLTELNPISKLHVEGNRLVDEYGNTRILRGLSYIDQGHFRRDWYRLNGMYAMEEDFRVASQEWGADVMRMPVWRDSFYENTPEKYLEQWLDKQIDYTESYNMYAVVVYYHDDDLNITDLGRFWSIIARRYADRNHVLYEILAKPSKGDWFTWKRNAEQVIDLIRKYDPGRVCIVKAFNLTDLSQVLENPVNRPNVVYGTDPYPIETRGPTFNSQLSPDKQRTKWDIMFGNISKTYPVFVTELAWAPYGEWWAATNENYGKPMIAYCDELDIGWSAWNWSVGYPPYLLDDWDTYTPSYAGEVIKEYLLEHNR